MIPAHHIHTDCKYRTADGATFVPNARPVQRGAVFVVTGALVGQRFNTQIVSNANGEFDLTWGY